MFQDTQDCVVCINALFTHEVTLAAATESRKSAKRCGFFAGRSDSHQMQASVGSVLIAFGVYGRLLHMQRTFPTTTETSFHKTWRVYRLHPQQKRKPHVHHLGHSCFRGAVGVSVICRVRVGDRDSEICAGQVAPLIFNFEAAQRQEAVVASMPTGSTSSRAW